MGSKKRTWRDVKWRAVERLLESHDGIGELLKQDLLLGVAHLKRVAVESCYKKKKRIEGERQ